MKTPPEDPRLTAYLFDELPEADRQAFESELEQSAELRSELEQLRSVVASLQMEFDKDADCRLSDTQRAQLQDEVSAAGVSASDDVVLPARAGKSDAGRSRRSVWLAMGGVCLIAAVLAAASPMLIEMRQNARRTSSTNSIERSDSLRLEAEEVNRLSKGANGPLGASGQVGKEVSNLGIMSLPVGDNKQLMGEKKNKKKRKRTETDFMTGKDFMTAAGESFLKPERQLGQELQQINSEPNPMDLMGVDVTVQTWGEETGFIAADLGRGPGEGGDQFDRIVDNDFLRVADAPLSTFSIDVDTAAYSKVRMFLKEHNQLPRPDAVRLEELINYFPYDYEAPTDEHPFAVHQVAAVCPWHPNHQLVRIALKGQEIDQRERPASNLVFLLDVSGSMNRPNKLPLLQRGMKMLADQLSENDRVAIVVYAGAAGLVLDSTTGDEKAVIMDALGRLKAGGSTNGGAGIQLAYQTALDHFIPGGTNRVLLCTDGDFNVGSTGPDELVRMVEQHAKTGVFLSVLGFGMGNHNDSMLEQISNKGNGNYAFVDTENEARKVLVEQMSATLVTIAKDVKIQVEFNPAKVAAYRLIGYENRVLEDQDFNDDTKDAGEIGAGHTVTALYEVVPAGKSVDTAPPVDALKYQTPVEPTAAADSNELLTLKLRYKQPDGDTSTLMTFPLKDASISFQEADLEFQFAAAVASFGMLLRDSKYAGNATYGSVWEIAEPAASKDTTGYRQEFLQLVRQAAALSGEPIE